MKLAVIMLFLWDIGFASSYLRHFDQLESNFGDNNKTYELLHCVITTINQLFGFGNPLTIIASEESLLQFEESVLFRELGKHVVIKIFREYSYQFERTLERTSNYLVFVMTQDQFEKDFNKGLYNVSAKFLVVTDVWSSWLQSFTEHLIEHEHKRVAFLEINRPSETSLTTGHIGGCNAVNTNSSVIQFVKPKVATELNYARIEDDHMSYNPFCYGRNCNGLNKNKRKSFSGAIMSLIGQKYLMTMNKIEVPSWKRAVELLKSNKISLIYSTNPGNIYDFEGLEVLTWVKYDFVSVVDRFRNTSSLPSFRILKPFQPTIWYLMIAAYILTIFFALCINKLRAGGPNWEYLRIYDLCAMVFSQSVPHLPTKVGLRFYVGMWLFFIYIMTTAYHATYCSHIISGMNPPHLRTFFDVVKSQRHVAGSESYINVLRNSSEPTLRHVADRCTNMSSEEAIHFVLESDWLGLLRIEAVPINNWKNRGNKSRQLYVLHDTLIPYPLIFVMRKNEVPTIAYRKTIHTTREMGILVKLERDSQKLRLRPFNEYPIDDTNTRTIKLVHLIEFLQIFILSGFLIATSIFLIEIIIDWCKRR